MLITGGQNSTNGNLNSAEVYDPLTGTFSAAPNMLNGRQQHIAVLLDNNKILIAGGYSCCTNVSAELFDPATNVFTATTGAMIVSNRGAGAAAKLFNGTVLVTGGQSGDVRAEAELYDPATDAFTAVGSMSSKRYQHTATLSPDGTILITGGFDAQSQASYTLPLATLERYIPGLGFVDAGSMEARRATHAAVRLSSDKTLARGRLQPELDDQQHRGVVQSNPGAFDRTNDAARWHAWRGVSGDRSERQRRNPAASDRACRRSPCRRA